MLKRDRQYAYNLTMRRVRATIIALEKRLSIKPTYSECIFVDLSIQYAMRLRHIVVCDLSGFTIFFSTLPHNRRDFRKKEKVIEHEMCVLIYYTAVV